MSEQEIWRKLPPVNVPAIEMTIGRHHLRIIGGLKINMEFINEERILLFSLLTAKNK